MWRKPWKSYWYKGKEWPFSGCSVPQCIFTSCFILISNSVEDPQYLGTINGLTQTLNMFFRALSPTAGGSIFAWSTSQRGRFINANLWFYCVGFLYVVMFLLSCFLSPRVEERKFVTEKYEEPKKEDREWHSVGWMKCNVPFSVYHILRDTISLIYHNIHFLPRMQHCKCTSALIAAI